jgi:regulator of replication initiation timing
MNDKLDYARKVQAETDDYIRSILAQTQRLRTVAASLQAEQERLELEVSRLRDELFRREEDGRQVRTLLEDVSRENQESLDRYQAVVAQNASLANLYVATYRLHGTVDKNEVLSGMQEVIANLIGCEEIAILEVEAGGALMPIWTLGVEGRFDGLVPADGVLGTAAKSGQTVVVEPGAQTGPAALAVESGLSAAVPLTVDGHVIGVIALFRLLPQKFDGLTGLDKELLNLLATHGATALYCTQLHAARMADSRSGRSA